MKQEKKVMSSDGVHMLSGVVYLPHGETRGKPSGKPRGLFQVVHGMTEHIARYHEFMQRMAEEGYICFGYDHLGHGLTAGQENLGFIAHRQGWQRLAQDVGRFAEAVRYEYQPQGETLPWILMGHSMGSFVVRVAAARYARPDQLIVMGTGGSNPASGIGLAVIAMVKAFCGEKHISPLVDKLAFGSYNRRFKEEKDDSAWLTRDRDVREAYRKDPYCNFKFTVSAMEDLVQLNRKANARDCFDALSRDLPILLLSGREDPVGNYGKGVSRVYRELKKRGADVEMKLYPDARHEILNDACRAEVVTDIIRFTGGK